jgi:hypothetical protein
MIRLDSPSLTIRCLINSDHIDALYNPVVGINIMSASLAQHLIKHMTLTPNYKIDEESFRTHCPLFRNPTHPTHPGRRDLNSFELLCLSHMGLRPVDRATF